MAIFNQHGKAVANGVLVSDIIRDHLSSQELFVKRKLSFSTREEFLEQLQKVFSPNTKIYSELKNALKENDMEAEKKMRRKAKASKKAVIQHVVEPVKVAQVDSLVEEKGYSLEELKKEILLFLDSPVSSRNWQKQLRFWRSGRKLSKKFRRFSMMPKRHSRMQIPK